MKRMSDESRRAMFARMGGVSLRGKRKYLRGGLSDGVGVGSFNPAALARGIRVEAEHTRNKRFASEIARDHLIEDPKYYQKLKAVSLRSDDPIVWARRDNVKDMPFSQGYLVNRFLSFKNVKDAGYTHGGKIYVLFVKDGVEKINVYKDTGGDLKDLKDAALSVYYKKPKSSLRESDLEAGPSELREFERNHKKYKGELKAATEDYLKAVVQDQAVNEIDKRSRVAVLSKNNFVIGSEWAKYKMKVGERIIDPGMDDYIAESEWPRYFKLVHEERLKRGLKVPNWDISSDYLTHKARIDSEDKMFNLGLKIMPEKLSKEVRGERFIPPSTRKKLIDLMAELALRGVKNKV